MADRIEDYTTGNPGLLREESVAGCRFVSPALEEGEQHIRLSSVFNEPTADVVFKTSDNVLLRVDDYYLKANSGFFKDMLCKSTSSSSDDNPISIDEKYFHFRIMLIVIAGDTDAAFDAPRGWDGAAKLYGMMDKYQLDCHRAWFSQMCGRWVMEDPLAALFLACNRPFINTILAQYAIQHGLSSKTCYQTFV